MLSGIHACILKININASFQVLKDRHHQHHRHHLIIPYLIISYHQHHTNETIRTMLSVSKPRYSVHKGNLRRCNKNRNP
jgi:hypothetical protein